MLFLLPGWLPGVQINKQADPLFWRNTTWWTPMFMLIVLLHIVLYFLHNSCSFSCRFMEKVILAISLPKASFLLLPILSPQRSFIKVMKAHVISMFVWIHACMRIHDTFTFDKCFNKQNFSPISAFKKANKWGHCYHKNIFFLHLEENARRYGGILLGNNQYLWIYHVMKTEGNEQTMSINILRSGY